MIGLFGILLSLCLLMLLAYRGYNVIYLAPLLAMVAVVFSGNISQAFGVYTQVFMTGLGGFAIKYFPIFLLGAIFGKLMDESGSARSIAYWFVHKLGNRYALLSIVLSSAILTYGGVSQFVVAFAVYPIAATLFKETNLPKRLIPGAIVLGALTFTMTALPGSPVIQNVIPMPYFKTTAFAAPGLGVIATIIMFIGGMLWLNYRTKKALSSAEGYGVHIKNEAEEHENTKLPHIVLALLPIIIVIFGNYIFTNYLFPSLDTTYLQEKLFGQTTLSSVLGIWSIILALVLACLFIICLNFTKFKNLKNTVNEGVIGSLQPIFNTASEVGYGSVIASLAAFAIVQEFLMGIAPANPLISEAIVINMLAGITGSASGGLSIALEAMGDTYLALGAQFNISPELLHRVASIASGGLDSLPHNGAVISLLTICGLTHRESYLDIFMVCLVIPIIALIVVITLGTVFGSF